MNALESIIGFIVSFSISFTTFNNAIRKEQKLCREKCTIRIDGLFCGLCECYIIDSYDVLVFLEFKNMEITENSKTDLAVHSYKKYLSHICISP